MGHLAVTIFHFNNSLYVLQKEVSNSIKYNGLVLPEIGKPRHHPLGAA